METYLRFLLMTILPAAIAIATLHTAIAGEGGLVRYAHMEEERGRLNRQVEAQRDSNARLAREIAHLRDDPVILRRAIAEDLQLVSPGSVVYRFAPARSAVAAEQSAEESAPTP
jgi:cell division protein FtsB